MDLHNNRVGYDNAGTNRLYAACLRMRRAATKANAYDASDRSISGATIRQLVYIRPDGFPGTLAFHIGSPSACVQP